MYLQEQPVASSKMICARLHTAGSECDRNTSSARLRSLHPRAIVPSMAASPGSSGLSKTSDILETSQFPFQEQLFRPRGCQSEPFQRAIRPALTPPAEV